MQAHTGYCGEEKKVIAEGYTAPVKPLPQQHFYEQCIDMCFRNVSLKSESNLRCCLDTTSRITSVNEGRKREALEKY